MDTQYHYIDANKASIFGQTSFRGYCVLDPGPGVLHIETKTAKDPVVALPEELAANGLHSLRKGR